MAINIKVTPADCIQQFEPKAGLKGRLDSMSFDQVAGIALKITPDVSGTSPIREITWQTNIPVTATDANRSNFERLVDEALGAATNVLGSFSGEVGFESGAAIATQLAKTVRNVGVIFGAKFDQRQIAVRQLSLKFERTGDDAGKDIYYGYVLGAEARWLREDHDDKGDTGYFRCERLEDTLIPPVSGEKKLPEVPGITGLYDSPLVAAGPYVLPKELGEVAVDFIATPVCQIDFEFTTTEFFVTIVQQMKLKIYASTDKTFLDSFIQPPEKAANGGREIGAAIDRHGRRLGAALVALRPQPAVPETADLAEAQALVASVRRGEVADLRAVLGDAPVGKLRNLALAAGVRATKLSDSPDRLTREILNRLVDG